MSKILDSFETYYKFKKVNEENPIIFIHGIGLNHEIWDGQISYFKKYNTIVYDLIGHGKTPLNKKQISMKDFTKQLLSLVDNLNITKFHLIGFSLGSLIARDFASLHNDRLSSLTIFGTVYKRSENEYSIPPTPSPEFFMPPNGIQSTLNAVCSFTKTLFASSLSKHNIATSIFLV